MKFGYVILYVPSSPVVGLGAIVWLGGRIWLDATATFFGLATLMLGKLWFMDWMVWVQRDHERMENRGATRR